MAKQAKPEWKVKEEQELLDLFASAALTGIIAAHSGAECDLPWADETAERAYRYAFAMMAERALRDEVGKVVD
jgi:hypothetical protein